jgi:hypothetical protein
MDPEIRSSFRRKSRGYKLDSPALIHPSILVGSGEMLTSNFVNKWDITHVINCAKDEDSPTWFKVQFPDAYECIGADDTLDTNILKWYPRFSYVLKKYIQDPQSKRIFVHCQCGINRSAFLATMFACDVMKFEYKVIEHSLISQRPCAMTNPSFRTQVMEALAKISE